MTNTHPRWAIGMVIALITVFYWGTAVPGAVITFVDAPPSGTGTDFRITQATGVNILGTNYDAMFHYGGLSYDDLELLVPMPITFGIETQAAAASTALATAINSSSTDASLGTLHTGTYDIPFQTSGSVVLMTFGHKMGNNPLSYAAAPGSNTFHQSLVPLPPNDAWVTFSESAAVPEPSTFSMLGMATIAIFGYFNRKRKRAT